MQKVLIVKNKTREGAGLLDAVLEERGLEADVVDLDKGESFPEATGYAAVFVLGGPDSANDTSTKMLAELVRVKEILAAGIPYLGICLGLQVLVKAAGGSVVKNAVPEIGLRDPDGNRFAVQLTEEGKSDPLFKDLDDPFNVFHLHGETVEILLGMTLLATGKFCENQIVRVGERAYGIQSHFELTDTMFETWLTEDPDLKQTDQSVLRADYAASKESYAQTGRTLLNNFLDASGACTK